MNKKIFDITNKKEHQFLNKDNNSNCNILIKVLVWLVAAILLILVSIILVAPYVFAIQQNTTISGTTYISLQFIHNGNECTMNYTGVSYNCSDSLSVPQLPVPFTINYSYETNVTYLLSNLSGNLSLVDSSKLFNLSCPGGEDLKSWFIGITPGQIVAPITNAIMADTTSKFGELRKTIDYERVIQDLNVSRTQCEAQLQSLNFISETSRGRNREYSVVFMILIGLGGLGLLFSGFMNYNFKRRMQSDRTNMAKKE